MEGFCFKHYTIMISSDKQLNYSVTSISAKTFRETPQWHQQALSKMRDGSGCCGLFSGLWAKFSIVSKLCATSYRDGTASSWHTRDLKPRSWKLLRPLWLCWPQWLDRSPRLQNETKCAPLWAAAQLVNNPTPSWSPLTGDPSSSVGTGGRGGIWKTSKGCNPLSTSGKERAFNKGALA